MAYVEVWKSGELVIRRQVDEKRARRGARVRLGSTGEVRIAVGQSKKVGKFEVRMLQGEAPPSLEASVGGPARDLTEEPAPYPSIEGYEITNHLGEGGMGTVWRAVQLSTRREVALKLLAKRRFGSRKSHRRFEREVELTARLVHPNIARLYESGLYLGIYYYAMELIEGVPMDRYVEDNNLSQEQILKLMWIVCQAVHHAHQRGVIHRDLKPSNILVSKGGQPHVLDFGLAKTFLQEDPGLTISIEGEVAGTPAYMSPEQAAGKVDQLDMRTDVYSLGVILFRLLTGQSPHDTSGARYELIRRIVEEEVLRPREIKKDIDRELEVLLLKALAHDPDERYLSAGDLADDIDNYLKGEPLMAEASTSAYFLRKKFRKHRWPIAVTSVGLALLAVIFVVGYSYIRALKRSLQQQITSTLVIASDQIPMKVGDKWTFKTQSENENIDGKEYTYCFYDSFEHQGKTFFRRRAEIPEQLQIPDRLQVLGSDGWFSFLDPDDEVPWDILKLPLSAGMEWEQDVLVKDEQGNKQLKWNKWRAEAEEMIQVPAGKFRCIRVRYFNFTPHHTDDALVWLAPNVGLVKFVHQGKHTFNLVNFERSTVSAPRAGEDTRSERERPSVSKKPGAVVLSDFDGEDPLVPALFPNSMWGAGKSDEAVVSTCQSDSDTEPISQPYCLRWDRRIESKTWANVGLLLSGSWAESVDLSQYDSISFYVKALKHGECYVKIQAAPRTGLEHHTGEAAHFYVTNTWQRIRIRLKTHPELKDLDLSKTYTIEFILFNHKPDAVENTIWLDDIMLHRVDAEDSIFDRPVVSKKPGVVVLSDFDGENPFVPALFPNSMWKVGRADETVMSICDGDRNIEPISQPCCLRWEHKINHWKHAGVDLLLTGSWEESVDLSQFESISFYVKGLKHGNCNFHMASDPFDGKNHTWKEADFYVNPQWQMITIQLKTHPQLEGLDLSRVYNVGFGLFNHEKYTVSNTVWFDNIILHR